MAAGLDLDDLRGLFQPKPFYDSILARVGQIEESQLTSAEASTKCSHSNFFGTHNTKLHAY